MLVTDLDSGAARHRNESSGEEGRLGDVAGPVAAPRPGAPRDGRTVTVARLRWQD